MRDFLQRFRRGDASTAVAVESRGDPALTFDAILRAAATEGASDVHFEPKEDGLVVRFSLDGEMHGPIRLPVAQREALRARGKMFGGMDITERRLPQDGRAVLRERGVNLAGIRLLFELEERLGTRIREALYAEGTKAKAEPAAADDRRTAERLGAKPDDRS